MAQKTSKSSWARPQPSVRRSNVVGYTIAVLVAALIAGPLGAVIGYAVGRPDASQAAIAAMQEADVKRDAQQIGELTALARASADDLNKVLAGLAQALPQDRTSAAQPAGPEQIDGWQQILRQTVDKHADAPSGTTATNVARGGFRSAVNALVTTVDTYAASRQLPESARQTFLDLAARQRSVAVMMWSVAATQLDQLNVDAGNGHQHAYLTSTPEEGAITADDVPEGTSN
ncbi:hypothetical protein SAMN05216276_103484 [Streptosporangium subroseum]|uniref:Uncharacterized protein n=1 Tax=Streptosporangium subroseum TaxID=106412 RepID=A0A239LQD3_9ACTN|nr:hypothetical protein SAMN05216276_103484 [Streptosporangium subroseum]